VPGIDAGNLPAPLRQGDSCPGRQPGGRGAAEALLRSFLTERSRPYRKAMSSPGPAAEHCSRLSPHLAWGTLSMREVLQATEARLRALDADADRDRRAALVAFASRLRWRCHFMQKLESEPELEHRCLHAAYQDMRGADERRLAAWAAGTTGWPFVDACMRMLDHTGWLNFRMRAMLMSVASFQLWQNWREPGLHLARLFTDYEPGIHWPQAQMQSGASGINTIRMYNPIKQGLDQDPGGGFIRQWCPELVRIPTARLHMPWTMSALEQADTRCVIGRDYPAPVVDHIQSAREARERVWKVRAGLDYGAAADRIQARHGSRRSGLPQPRANRTKPNRQLILPL
jgi:deoxyribodipyrimidine photo-lyase